MANIIPIGGKDSLIVDLGDAGSFANEQALATSRVVGLEITNATGIAQKVIINPAYFGSDASKVIRDGAIIPLLTCRVTTGSKTVAEMLAWHSRRAVHILQVQVESNNTSQLNQVLTTQVRCLYGDEQQINLNIASFKKAGNLNDKFLVVSQDNLYFDDETEMSIIVPGFGDSTVVSTFTFYCGAVLSTPVILYKALRQAKMAA